MSSQCNYEIQRYQETYWNKLTTPNSWLFSGQGNEDLYVSCQSDDSETLKLPPAGILKLSKKCEVKTKNARLATSQQITALTEIKLYNRESLNISSIISQTASGL